MRKVKRVVVLTISVALVSSIGGCSDERKKQREMRKRAMELANEPVVKDLGPHSCDLRETKQLCMQYSGANSTEADIQQNCAGWEEATYLPGACPADGAIGACVQVLGPSTIRMVFYQGADPAEQEQSCRAGGNTWEKMQRPAPAPSPAPGR